MGDGVAGSDWTYPAGADPRVLKLWLEAAYLDAYAAWLSLLPHEKQMYPMPKKPAVE